MKSIKKNSAIKYLLILIMIGSIACKKGYFYDGINEDPSQLKTPVPSSLLPGIILSTGYLWGGDASRFVSIFMQQTTGGANQSFLANKYSVTSDDVDNMWTAGLYGGGIMNNTHALIHLADSLGQQNYAAIGRILMANSLMLTTDLWGDIPYSEAFLGIANTQPHYDTQEKVYASIDALLTQAITTLNGTDPSPFQPGSDDLLFNGNLTSWLQFAHSLRAKMFIHLAKVNASNYTNALNEVASGFTPGTNAGVRFLGSSVTSESPWYQFNDQRADIIFTGHIYDLLAATNDPRLSVYSDGDGGLGTLYGSPNSTIYLMTYEELKFIEAEAAFHNGDKSTAAAAYNSACEASLTRTINNTSYLSQIEKTAGNLTLADIMTQKYIALFLSPEVWTDWRRTGLPALVPPAGSVLGGQLPRSLLYPSGEIRYNANAPKNTSMSRRVWWDVQ